jgi:CpeT/CpcT family (DUF1001)
MSPVRTWLSLVLAGSTLVGCRHAAPSQAPASPASPELQKLERYMTGAFSSAAQSKEDSRFFDIRLYMIPIWRERTDGPWLYVEQAAAAKLDKPYRQRVYRLRALPDGRVESQVFLLPGDALRFANAWQRPESLKEVSPEQLVPREGCSILLVDEGDALRGSTVGQACPSELRGATYATSEVTVKDGTLFTWDRGYDAQNQQVWGSEHGPYRFERVALESPDGPR